MNKKPIISTAQMSVDEVRASLAKYLDGVQHELHLSTLGTNVYVSLVYYDFKPRRVVRNEIEDMAPNIEVEDIQREYSPTAIVSAYYEDGDDPQPVYVRLGNGELIPTDVHTLLTERLSRRNFCDRPTFSH